MGSSAGKHTSESRPSTARVASSRSGTRTTLKRPRVVTIERMSEEDWPDNSAILAPWAERALEIAADTEPRLARHATVGLVDASPDEIREMRHLANPQGKRRWRHA